MEDILKQLQTHVEGLKSIIDTAKANVENAKANATPETISLINQMEEMAKNGNVQGLQDFLHNLSKK